MPRFVLMPYLKGLSSVVVSSYDSQFGIHDGQYLGKNLTFLFTALCPINFSVLEYRLSSYPDPVLLIMFAVV